MRSIIRDYAAAAAGVMMALALLLPIKAMATSSLQSLVASPSTVAAGQNVTITFQYMGTNTGCKTACFATFSNQSTLRNGGTTGQVIFYDENGVNRSDTQENGPGASSTVSENNAWHNSTDFTSAIYYTVPAATTPGTYYLIIAVRDCNIYMNPGCCSNIDNQASVAITVGAAGSATNTPAATNPTYTNTPVATKSFTNSPTYTKTAVITTTNTPLPSSTRTNTPVSTTTNTPAPTATNSPVPQESISNILVSPNPVAAGQNVTITFNYIGTNTGCKDALMGLLSNSSSLQPDGTAGQVALISEKGINVSNSAVSGGLTSSINGNNTSQPSSNFGTLYMTVPSSWASGTYYVILGINACNIYLNPNFNGSGVIYSTPFTVIGGSPTFTPIPATFTNTPVPTPVNTATQTPNGSGSGNATNTAIAAATNTAIAVATNTAQAIATNTAQAQASQTVQATQTQGQATATAQAQATNTAIAATATQSAVNATATSVYLSYTPTYTSTYMATPVGNAWALPRVDLENSTVNTQTGMTIWSYSNTWLPAGTLVTLKLPSSTYVPATLTAACQCLFVRDTSPGGAYGSEQAVTYTAYTAPSTISFTLPQAMGKGTFYIRLDYTMVMKNPPNPGPATLTLDLPGLVGGNMMSSKAYVITPAGSGSTLGAITGKVVASSSINSKINGRPLAGALVAAWSGGGNPWPTSWGPRAAQVDALDTTVNVYTAVTASDGSYSISLPALPTGGSIIPSYSVNAMATDNYPMLGTAVNSTYFGVTQTAVAVTANGTTYVNLSVTVQ